jgi:hypothetical protein
MSNLEKMLWGTDFVLSALGWFFGGAYPGVLSFLIGGLLIFSGFVGLDKVHDGRSERWALDAFGDPYVPTRRLRIWHKAGLVLSFCLIVVTSSFLL